MALASFCTWLPPGKTAAVCLSVDDVHPTAADGATAVGEVARTALDHLRWLLEQHPQLHATLFTTPDWRSRSVHPTRRIASRVPLLRNLVYPSRPLPRGTLRVDRHPAFVSELLGVERTDVGLHGLHHLRRGPAGIREFEGRTREQCRRMLLAGQRIMSAAGITLVPGFAPPAWSAPLPLLEALGDVGVQFVTSARDLDTPIAHQARAHGSGLHGVPLFEPSRLAEVPLVHITTNFQATSPWSRADSILRHGGLLAVKAHLLKRFGTYQALDGLDREYVGYLHEVFSRIEDAFGDRVWWTSMARIAERVVAADTSRSAA